MPVTTSIGGKMISDESWKYMGKGNPLPRGMTEAEALEFLHQQQVDTSAGMMESTDEPVAEQDDSQPTLPAGSKDRLAIAPDRPKVDVSNWTQEERQAHMEKVLGRLRAIPSAYELASSEWPKDSGSTRPVRLPKKK